jgi:hypothetical protein
MEAVLMDLFEVKQQQAGGHYDAGFENNAISSAEKITLDDGDSQNETDHGEDKAGHYKLHYRRTAPLGSLLSQLALHSLVFGNARAIAELWRRYWRGNHNSLSCLFSVV